MHEIDGVGSLDIDKDNPEKVNDNYWVWISAPFSLMLSTLNKS